MSIGTTTLRMTAGALLAFLTGICNAQDLYSIPSWNQKLVCDAANNCPRFVVLSDWNGTAVLDKETGLVWEKTPNTSLVTWSQADMGCNRRIVAGRMGWRLPTVQELSRLGNGSATQYSILVLPAGHPFQLSRYSYWTSTLSADNPLPQYATHAWYVTFFGSIPTADPTTSTKAAWCVRGGQVPPVQ